MTQIPRPPLSLPAKWPAWQRRRVAWAFALFDARQGDPSTLAELMRRQSIPRQYRAEVAELLKRLSAPKKRRPKRRPGIRSRLRSGDVFWILGFHYTFRERLSRDSIVRYLARRYSVSKGTISDVLSACHTFKWVRRDLAHMLESAGVVPKAAQRRIYRCGRFVRNLRER